MLLSSSPIFSESGQRTAVESTNRVHLVYSNISYTLHTHSMIYPTRNFHESNISEFNELFFADFFGISDDRLSGLYKIFSNQFNQMQWHEIWRHPVLKLSNGGSWESRTNREEAISWMEWDLPRAYDIIDEFELIVTKNKDHLELLRYLIYLDYWYIELHGCPNKHCDSQPDWLRIAQCPFSPFPMGVFCCEKV